MTQPDDYLLQRAPHLSARLEASWPWLAQGLYRR
jgi:hypothetical protein